ncbi:MAG: PD40 domain-containing protein [Spirochaetes bacterium]|nr:PD40 domain-containing protein [Spirochaetota bacterium]
MKRIILLSIVTVSLVSCNANFTAALTGQEQAAPVSYPAFSDETEVTINGHTLDAMEPFIAKDGSYLFYNSLNDGNDTSLYYAAAVNETTFTCMGKISNVNGTVPHLDGVASMDMQHNFYFVSTRNYPTVMENYLTATWSNGAVGAVTSVTGNFYIYTPGWLIMDAEINAAGNLLYYCNARFSGRAAPDEARLGIAAKNGASFNKISSSDYLLRNINDTSYIVYAPSISSDGKELFFTRMRLGTYDSEICVSIRSTTDDRFSTPKKLDIPAATGEFLEAPTLTGDGGRLYYHRKKISGDGKYHIFTMKRKR